MLFEKNRILQTLVIILFFVSPFVLSYENVAHAERISAQVLPSFITNIASIIRWTILGIFLLIALLELLNGKSNIKISSPVLFLFLFYLVQFIVSLIDRVDIFRFFLLTVLSLLVPPLLGKIVNENKKIITYMLYSILFFIIFSLLLNGHLLLIGYRFMGFMNNPNVFGISMIFWMLILFIAHNKNLVNKILFYILFTGIFMLSIFTGSRNALGGIIIIIILNYHSQFRNLFGKIFLLFFVVFITSYFLDLSFLTERITNYLNAINDSGRANVWRRAYHAIEQNFWFGNGMDANYRIANTGNMHNCYIRFVLNMGIIFTVISLSFYFISIIITYLNIKKVPSIFAGYLIVFSLMNIGEDLFIGVGSSVFIYLLFVYGLINYYITSNNINTSTNKVEIK